MNLCAKKPLVVTFVYLVGIAWAGLCSAQKANVGKPDNSGSNLYFDRCELEMDPNVRLDKKDLWFLTCVAANAGSVFSTQYRHSDEGFRLDHARGYLGFHINSFFSIHGQARAQRVYGVGEQATGPQLLQENEMAVMRFGNLVLHKWRMTIGRLQAPFGVGYSKVNWAYKADEAEKFWETPAETVTIAIDSQRDYVIELSASANYLAFQKDRADKDDDSEKVQKELNVANVVRVSHDIAALDGSRLMLSGYSDKNGEKKFGFGFITVSRRFDLTQFEWVRILASEERSGDFDQILRFGYLGEWQRNERWNFQFDDEHRRYRKAVLGFDKRFYERVDLRLAVSYYDWLMGSGFKRWGYVAGLEVRL